MYFILEPNKCRIQQPHGFFPCNKAIYPEGVQLSVPNTPSTFFSISQLILISMYYISSHLEEFPFSALFVPFLFLKLSTN